MHKTCFTLVSSSSTKTALSVKHISSHARQLKQAQPPKANQKEQKLKKMKNGCIFSTK